MEIFKTKLRENKKFILIIFLVLLLAFISIAFIYNYKFKDIYDYYF